MLKIFDYNSRSFTTLAIILFIVLGYLSYSKNESNSVPSAESSVGARYTMEIDPNSKDKTLIEKTILFVFQKDIDAKINSNKKNPPTHTFSKNSRASQAKVGDTVAVIYYQTNPMPIFIPDAANVIIGENKLPKAIDAMLVGMEVGEKREFKDGKITYHIELIDIL